MAELPVTGLFNVDNMKSPDATDVLLGFHLDADGIPVEADSGWYSVQDLVDALATEAREAEEAAKEAQEKAEESLEELEGKLRVGYRTIIGDGETTEFTITHNLGAEWVITQIWFTDLEDACYYRIQEIDENSLTITFETAPRQDGVDVRIVPNIRMDTIEVATDQIDAALDDALAQLEGRIHVGYRTVVGDGESTEFTITHNLSSEWVLTQVWFTDLEDACYYRIQEIDENSLTIAFETPPRADGVDVRIVPNVRIESEGGSSGGESGDVEELTEAQVADLIAILG